MSGKRREARGKRASTKKTASRPDEMAPDVLEFIQAIDDYKRRHARPFPSWSEILEVVKDLGYQKASTE